MPDRIPKGHRRVSLYEYDVEGKTASGQPRQRWSWKVQDANYREIKSAHEPFESKSAARRAAEQAEGVDFPDGQDYVDIPDPVAGSRRGR